MFKSRRRPKEDPTRGTAMPVRAEALDLDERTRTSADSASTRDTIERQQRMVTDLSYLQRAADAGHKNSQTHLLHLQQEMLIAAALGTRSGSDEANRAYLLRLQQDKLAALENGTTHDGTRSLASRSQVTRAESALLMSQLNEKLAALQTLERIQKPRVTFSSETIASCDGSEEAYLQRMEQERQAALNQFKDAESVFSSPARLPGLPPQLVGSPQRAQAAKALGQTQQSHANADESRDEKPSLQRDNLHASENVPRVNGSIDPRDSQQNARPEDLVSSGFKNLANADTAMLHECLDLIQRLRQAHEGPEEHDLETVMESIAGTADQQQSISGTTLSAESTHRQALPDGHPVAGIGGKILASLAQEQEATTRISDTVDREKADGLVEVQTNIDTCQEEEEVDPEAAMEEILAEKQRQKDLLIPLCLLLVALAITLGLALGFRKDSSDKAGDI